MELVEQYLTKILSQNISRVPGSINVVYVRGHLRLCLVSSEGLFY